MSSGTLPLATYHRAAALGEGTYGSVVVVYNDDGEGFALKLFLDDEEEEDDDEEEEEESEDEYEEESDEEEEEEDGDGGGEHTPPHENQPDVFLTSSAM